MKLSTNKIYAIIILAGIILRIAQFLYNRSLTEGESALAMNIINRSYSELLKPLDYEQAAPVGFLFIQKFFSNHFGNNDYSMRIFPLIAGILSIFLFYKLAKRLLNDTAILWGLILFVSCDSLIYFSSEVKQYSSDVAIAIIMAILSLDLLQTGVKREKFIITGIIGAIFLWFSHPSLFVSLSGIIALAFLSIKEKKYNKLPLIFLMIALGIISFVLNYNLGLGAISQNKNLVEYWQKSFMPLPPKSLSDLKWFGFVFLRLFRSPLGFSIYELFLPVLSFFIGLIVLWRINRYALAVFILPIILALCASGFHKYPFEGRLLLFITPLLFVVIARGIDFLRERTYQGLKVLSGCLVILIFIHPLIGAFYHLIIPRAPEELKPVMEYLKENKKQDDLIYLYYAAYNSFKYYSLRYGFSDKDYIVGIESRFNWKEYYKDLFRLKGKSRVWFIFSHVITTHGVDEEKLFLMFLDMLGKRIDQFNVSGASAYLYDLSEQPRLLDSY